LQNLTRDNADLWLEDRDNNSEGYWILKAGHPGTWEILIINDFADSGGPDLYRCGETEALDSWRETTSLGLEVVRSSALWNAMVRNHSNAGVFVLELSLNHRLMG